MVNNKTPDTATARTGGVETVSPGSPWGAISPTPAGGSPAEVWEVVTQTGFKVRTKNPVRTLDKLFRHTYKVAVKPPTYEVFYYVTKDDWDALRNGEKVTVPTTLTPFLYRKGMVEAWGKAYISINKFKGD